MNICEGSASKPSSDSIAARTVFFAVSNVIPSCASSPSIETKRTAGLTAKLTIVISAAPEPTKECVWWSVTETVTSSDTAEE